MKKKKSKKSKRRVQPLTPEELSRLDQFLEGTDGAMPMVQAHGLITAIASTPSPALGPSSWIGQVHGDHEFASDEEGQELTQIITRLYNQIVTDLNAGYFSGPQEQDDVRQWCRGYMAGTRLDEQWTGNADAVGLTMPVGLLADEMDVGAQSPDDEESSAVKAELLEELPNNVLAIHQFWNDWRKETLVPSFNQARVPTPEKKQKVGRNEKCPCGSGKKYKKCCGKKG